MQGKPAPFEFVSGQEYFFLGALVRTRECLFANPLSVLRLDTQLRRTGMRCESFTMRQGSGNWS